MEVKTFLKAIFFIFIISFVTYSQNTGWNVYTSMKDVRDISYYNNTVYAATTGGMFSFNYTSPQSTIKKYTTIDGMLNNQLLCIIVDNTGKKVWSGAADGSINCYHTDLNSWTNIPDIQTSTETLKEINGIFQYGRYMFFATDFSVLKFDVNTLLFVDQPYIYLGSSFPVKPIVYKVWVVNDTIWAASKSGIAFANINSNLPESEYWSDFTTGNSPMAVNKTNTIAYFNGKVYFGTDSGMYYYDHNVLNSYLPLYNGVAINGPISAMTSSGNSLYFSTYLTSNNTYRVDLPNLQNAQLVFSGIGINTIKPGYNGDILIGTSSLGLDIYRNNTNSYVLPNGPYSNLIYDIAVDGGSNLWEVSGPIGPWQQVSGIYKYNGNSWKNYLLADYPGMGGNGDGFLQVYPSRYSLGTNSTAGAIWFSGLGNGLVKLVGDNFTHYDDNNSILKSLSGSSGFPIVAGMDEDQNGKLWVLNGGTNAAFVNFTDSIAYPSPGIVTQSVAVYDYLVVDNYNTKWGVLFSNGISAYHGVVYFNEQANTGGFLDMTTVFGSDITLLNDIIKDKDGAIWIASNNGVFIISDPYQVIQNPNSVPTLFKMRIIENGLSTPLLENVYAIRCDAVNNKWIGTFSNGLLYVSTDGSTILNRLTHLNSPLIDDRIICMAADPGTGKIYVGTQSGLTSYLTVAVQPLSDCTNITAGPNPYIIPNVNLLKISGLVENSSIKILSISGKLIIDFPSPGGKIANWDGRDKNGNLVASGIYIIVGYNQDGTKVCTGKVAIIKK